MSDSLFAEFPPVSTAEWQEAIRRDTKGNPPPGKLFYRKEDLPQPLPVQPWARSTPWQIWAEVRDACSAQRALERGVQGLFAMTPIAGVDANLAQDFVALPHDWPIRRQIEEARNVPEARDLLVPVSPLYLHEIAKFRALRRIAPGRRIIARTSTWHETAYDPHVNLLRSTAEAMAAIAGGCDALIVGPFDAPQGGEPDLLAERLAINTQLLLRDEASFGLVEDPAAGSYYIEALTAALVNGEAVPEQPRRPFLGVNRYPNLSEAPPAAITTNRAMSALEACRMRSDRMPQRPVVRLTGAVSRADAAFAREFLAGGGIKVSEDAPIELSVAELRASTDHAATIADLQRRLGMEQSS